MSKKTYLRALNDEIQRLNSVIDYKILHDYNYHAEARRHKKLLRQLKKEERARVFSWTLRTFVHR